MNNVEFEVAGVRFVVELTEEQHFLQLPEIYRKFIHSTVGKSKFPTVIYSGKDSIILEFQTENDQLLLSTWVPLSSEPSWQVEQNQQGDYIFRIEKPLPPRALLMKPDFSSGLFFIDSSDIELPFFPLYTLDIVIFSNWLANRGDLILHAGGVAIDRQGYVFVGSSGAGKSTLVANMAEDNTVTVLGEDQVVLRYLEGRYWIFGTPWHLNPERCSPIGVPLKKIFFLDREAENKLSPISPQDGFKRLMQTAFIPYYRPVQVDLIMENLERLGTQIPYKMLAYHLGEDILKLIIEP